MSYTDKKITQEEINAHHVQGATDHLIGNAQQNKAVFDDLPEFIAEKHNELIDELNSHHGDEIKVAVDEWLAEHPEVTTTVQDNSLTTAKYVDGSVTEPKIAERAVTPSKLDRAYSTPADLASVNENLTNEINVLDARMDEFASLPEGSTTADAELTDIRVGANGTTYPTAGDAVRGQVAGLKSDISDIDETINGEIVSVTLDRFNSKLIASSGELLDGNNYSIFRFPMLDGATYKIVGKNNEVLRLGADNSDSTSWRMLPYVNTSADRSYLEYTNENGYAYGFIMGVTPSYPSAEFSVSYREDASALKDISDLKVEKLSLLSTNVAAELVGKGSKTVSYGSVEYNDAFTLSTGYSESFINLYSLSSNEDFDVINNFKSTEENEFELYDAIKIDVDVTISRTTFQHFAIGLKAPNSTTTVKTFFNVDGSALDPNNKFRFSRTVRLDIGTKFSVPFLYLQDSSASGSNRITITGSISVTKYKQSADALVAHNLPYSVIPQMDGDGAFIKRGNAKTIGKLKKLGNMIVDADNAPVELRGIGLHAICQYPNLHSWETFKCLRYMGCNLVRISVYLEDFQFSKSDGEIYYGYLSHPNENKAEIEKIIKNCVDLGMYVLLDWHVMDDQSIVVGPQYSGLDVLHQEEAEDFFEYYSSKYADCPNVLYEFANEPYSLTPAEMFPFISSLRSIVKNNVTDPIMVTGMGKPIEEGGIRDFNTYKRCKALYEELVANGITDVFTSPHIYGSNLSEMQQLLAEQIPFIMTEWGNSSYTGDGAGNDGAAIAQINWMHQNAIAHSIWKFTDQTMTSCLLKNCGFINSQRYFFGFNWNDLSHNGVLLLGRYYDYIREEWIERTAIE